MHAQLRRFLIVAITVATVMATITPAFASGSGDAWTDSESSAGGSGDAWTNGGTVGAHASDGDSAGGSGGGAGNGCTYHPLNSDEIAIAEDMAKHGIGPAPGDGPGTWYRRICPDGKAVIVWAPQGVDPIALAQEALSEASIPLPGIHLNPPESQEQVVNFETWLWVDDWNPVTATASAGGITVTVTATPERVDWSMGDGNSVSCAGPGTAYDTTRPPDEQRTDCSYTYQRGSASEPNETFVVQATSAWHVTWTATGVVGAGGDLGTITRTNTIPVRVAEIQAVNGAE